MGILSAIAKATGRLFNMIFGVITPPNTSRPPDIDGRRDSGDMSYDRAALEAKMQDRIGPGGTPGATSR